MSTPWAIIGLACPASRIGLLVGPGAAGDSAEPEEQAARASAAAMVAAATVSWRFMGLLRKMVQLTATRACSAVTTSRAEVKAPCCQAMALERWSPAK